MSVTSRGLRTAMAAVALATASSIVSAQTTVAGSTPGSFRVTESGAAEYRIPIRVPPGIAGMEPKLALVYNSQAGNGLLGVGWNLEGLSAITRCPQTIAQDGPGPKPGVNYTASDRYCLDGQRLIAMPGSCGPSECIEYRTERETFSRIRSYWSAGQGPMFFTVWTKSGQMMHYGYFEESRIQAQGRAEIRVWALSHVYAVGTGNSLIVNYFEDNNANGDYRPASIVYGNNHITFGYAGRADLVPAFQAGSKVLPTHLLTQVRAFVAGQLVSDVRIAYGQSPETSRPRMSTVTECTADGSQCLAPTTFAWQDGNTGYLPQSQWSWSSPSIGSENAYQHYFADVNGDGKVDLIQVHRGINMGYVGLSTGNGFETWTWESNQIGAANGFDHHFADVNGDGKADWIQINKASGATYVGFWTGNAFTTWSVNNVQNFGPPTHFEHRFADADGDGRADWIQISRGGPGGYVALSNGDGTFNQWNFGSYAAGAANDYQHEFADVNGDGKADWIQIRRADNGGWVGLSSGDPGSLFNLPGWGSYMIGPADVFQHQFADVNGDGKADWIQIRKDSNAGYVGLGNGDSSFTTWTWPSPNIGAVNDYEHHFADVNGDGKADWIQIARASNVGYFGLSTGDGSFPTWNWGSYSIGSVNDYQHSFADVNGDGKADWIQLQRAANNGYVGLASGPMTDLLVSVNNGIGQVTTIAHAPLTNPGVYMKDNNASYPMLDLQTPMYVVSNFQASNGVAGTNATHFMYGGLKVELGTGRGLLGFRWMDSYHPIDGAVIRNHAEFRQDWPYIGLAWLTSKSHGAGSLLSQVSNNFACINPQTGAPCTPGVGNRYFPHVSNSFTMSSDLNGAALPTVNIATSYDVFGNATTITSTTNDGHSKTTTNTFMNDEANWLIGRLIRSIVNGTSP